MSSPSSSYATSNRDVVLLEDTPSPPPPKPPRGVLRSIAPMKPQRSLIRIEPATQNDTDKENDQKPSQFKAKNKMEHMQAYFKRSIEAIKNSMEFTGKEATDIMEAYILSHKDSFQREDVGRTNAVLLLEVWRKDNFFRCVHSDIKSFVDCDKTYFVLSENESSLYYANSPAPPTRMTEIDTNSLQSRSSRRNNSFKRLFSPLVRRNRSNSRGRGAPEEKETTFLKSTWSLFSSSDRNERKAKQAAEQTLKEEEADVYQLALFHLLSIVDVEFLEDVALPIDDTKKNASFLTSIMEKMGLGNSEDRLDIKQEDNMDLLLETHPLIKPAAPWFQMARVCAPMLYLEMKPERGKAMQLYVWCKEALKAVTDRLEKVTRNGESPLIPNEFGPIITKIAEQLIGNFKSDEKLNLAVLYLFLMIPSPVRETIDNIVQWLQLTLRTDSVEDLRSPFYLGRKEPRHKENYHVIVQEIRHFIFPKGCLTNVQQDVIIETMVDLRNEKRLGRLPKPLEESLHSKLVYRNEINKLKLVQKKKCKNEDEPTTPVRYAVAPRESLREKNRRKDDRADLTQTEDALVSMIESMLNDTKMSLTDKTKQLQNFAKQYPRLYSRFFNGML